MSIIELLASLSLLLVPLFFYLTTNSWSKAPSKSNPKSYPLIGSSAAIFANRNRDTQWTSDLIQSSPTATVVLRRFLDDTRIKRFLNTGSEKRLKEACSELREFARNIIKEKKQELSNKPSLETVDLLSRFLSSGHSDEDFVTDIVISFILAGRDTTSAALTWYFWLLSQNPEIEKEILREIKDKSESPVYEEVKDMVYTHASLCESMRLYPPVPIDGKVALRDDVLPDGTVIKKGMRVLYHPYAMGRLEMLWGPDWEEFKPERWLQRAGDGVSNDGKWSFVGRDPYSYPVFQAGPRICLGKDMAFLQMKRVVAGILRRFKVVPAAEDGVEPVFVSFVTSKMEGGNPANVQHILKTKFYDYEKGSKSRQTLFDFLGNGIFNIDGDSWKFQRQVSSHEFNTKSLRKFVETVVDTEVSQRLIPILSTAAANNSVLDLQDILQRFAFDNICKIAFGYDPAYLLPDLPETEFAKTFDDAAKISSGRFATLFPFLWKIKRFLNIGSEKRLKEACSDLREFARNIIKEKKQELSNKPSLETVDLLSRFLSSGHSDEDFVTDIVISFILAGRDTTSAALTWYFWLLSQNPEIEKEILREIKDKSESPVYEEVKDMVYTHASLCESMRLYPPVPIDGKVALRDDVLPDGTVIKKGMRVSYHPYAMGRLEMLWGPDWEEFKPERWLQRAGDGVSNDGKWSFVGRDPYSYPVFQAGPRICLGKDMAFLQMKRVVAGILRRFKVVPAAEDGVEPVFVSFLTSKMEGGFPVRFEERAN
uniref:Cytochrome P450 n=1 Tax=Salix viminalis TaxID=40686 RepID=A0A6N2LMY2_SALVM